jgi:hypothetical protein
MAKIWETIIIITQQLIKKEAVVPKEFKYLRRRTCCRPAGPPLRANMANWGFLSY